MDRPSDKGYPHPKVRDVVPAGQPHRYGVSLLYDNRPPVVLPWRTSAREGPPRAAGVTSYYAGPRGDLTWDISHGGSGSR